MPQQGHNAPPAYDPDVFAEIEAKAAEFIKASQAWLDQEEIATEEQASALTDQIDGLRGLFRRAESLREDAKKPHLEAGRAVDGAFNGVKKKLETCANQLKEKLTPYLERKQQEIEAAEQAKREAAEAAQRAADEAQRKADESGGLQAQFDAEDAEQAAADAQAKADEAARKRPQARSATGAGRTIGLRDVSEVEITNIRVLFMHYQDHPDVAATLLRLAKADVRAKDVDHSRIPGITVTKKKVAA